MKAWKEALYYFRLMMAETAMSMAAQLMPEGPEKQVAARKIVEYCNESIGL